MTAELRKAVERRIRTRKAVREAAELIAREREERLARERAIPIVTAEPLPEGPAGSGEAG